MEVIIDIIYIRLLIKNLLRLGALEDKFWKRFCEIINAPKSIVSKK